MYTEVKKIKNCKNKDVKIKNVNCDIKHGQEQ